VPNGDDYYSDEDYDLYGNLLDQGVDPDQYTTIYDDYGDIIIEGTFEDLYEYTLIGAEDFEELYGDYSIRDLIQDLEVIYDVEWDWDTWRELYG
jgi:hypothetical protein